MALKSSPHFAMLLLLFHAAAAAAVCLTALPLFARLVILVPVVMSLSHSLIRDALLRLPGSWREIRPGQDDVSVVTRDGSGFSGKVAGSTVVTPWFVVLGLRPEGCWLPVTWVIFPDMLGRDEFRSLRVRLRFQ